MPARGARTLLREVDFRGHLRMLRLTFHAKSRAAAQPLELSDLRVSGGALWDPMQHGLIAAYSGGAWMHRGHPYSILSITGGGCLLFGITRDPTIVSDPIDHFYFIGSTLSANGVAIAKYVEQQEMWHGLVRPMWWRAMRIIVAAGVSGLNDESQLVILNPWEPHPSRAGLSDRLADQPTKASAATRDEGAVAPPSDKGLLR